MGVTVIVSSIVMANLVVVCFALLACSAGKHQYVGFYILYIYFCLFLIRDHTVTIGRKQNCVDWTKRLK